MKKEQILDMIGEAPDEYVKDAADYRKKRIPRWSKWVSGMAAVLAAALLVNHTPEIPLIITAKAVSKAAAPRITERPKNGSSPEEFDAWQAEIHLRNALVQDARVPIGLFAETLSRELLTGTDTVNRVWSPVNAYIALAMTAELTGSETQAQLLSLLGVSDTAELRRGVSAVWEKIYQNNGKEISVLANSLWLDKDVDYMPQKMDTLARDYYASVYQGDLGSTRTNRDITNWMRSQTGGLLKDRTGNVQLDPEDGVLTLASTIYFQSRWNDEFRKADNTQAIFHAADRDVECTFMNKTEAEMNYYWGEDFGAVKMYLENSSAMWFILPDEGKTADDVLNSGDFMEILTASEFPEDGPQNQKWMKVNLSVPQFDVSAGLNLRQALQNVGVSALFDPAVCDLSPSVLPSEDFRQPPHIASIHQDTRVKIDEEGVAAASYIEIVGAGAAAPPDEIIDFILDRPFVFAVTKSQIPLFLGTVNRP